MDRLDKILVSQNFGSRKEVHKLIKSGCVCVDGKVCKECDSKIEPQKNTVKVNGKPIDYEKYEYIMMNKPPGVLSASRDKKQKTVIDLLPPEFMRKGLFPAGRLDKDTEGLLIITDDGEYAHRMLSPKNHIAKRYIAKLDKEITDDTISSFKKGIIFADKTKCMPSELELLEENNNFVGIVTIYEGKFHQVKKMFATCGINVVHLKRISIGKLYLDSNLPIGKCKKLSNLDKELVFVGKLH